MRLLRAVEAASLNPHVDLRDFGARVEQDLRASAALLERLTETVMSVAHYRVTTGVMSPCPRVWAAQQLAVRPIAHSARAVEVDNCAAAPGRSQPAGHRSAAASGRHVVSPGAGSSHRRLIALPARPAVQRVCRPGGISAAPQRGHRAAGRQGRSCPRSLPAASAPTCGAISGMSGRGNPPRDREALSASVADDFAGSASGAGARDVQPPVVLDAGV